VLAPLPKGYTGAKALNGDALLVQEVGGKLIAEVKVPACGWATVLPTDGGQSAGLQEGDVRATPTVLENELLRVAFGVQGDITSIYDKEARKELAVGPCNCLRMYKDIPTSWDAWDVDSVYEYAPAELLEPANIEVVAQGPLVGVLRIVRKLGNSPMTQEVSLRRGSRRVDFRTHIDWRESHKLLKVCFPVDIHANEAVHEIQFGHIHRPNHRSRQFDADRFEVVNHKWTALVEENRGFAVLNDCKYGVNVLGNSINLTLLRAPLAPDMTADKGPQEFAYAFCTWNGSLGDSPVVREAYDLNCPAITAPGAAGERSLFAVDAPNVVIETVKPAEDGSRDVVLRLYEVKRTATRCTLATSLPLERAALTDMLERPAAALSSEGGTLFLDFKPFEIKTVRLTLGTNTSTP
jgi:alpha-mannosidase